MHDPGPHRPSPFMKPVDTPGSWQATLAPAVASSQQNAPGNSYMSISSDGSHEIFVATTRLLVFGMMFHQQPATDADPALLPHQGQQHVAFRRLSGDTHEQQSRAESPRPHEVRGHDGYPKMRQAYDTPEHVAH